MPTLPRRRDVLRMLALGGAAAAAWKLGWPARSAAPRIHRTRVLMGTEVHLTIVGPDPAAADAAAEATLQRMGELEAILSRYLPDSEVSRLNAGETLEQAAQPLIEVLEIAERVSRLGDGAFDITVQPVLDLWAGGAAPPAPESIEQAVARVDFRRVRIDGRRVSLAPETRITLDGVGKGYIVDRAIETLAARGFRDVFVEAGGDLVAGGERQPGWPWRVGVRHPRRGPGLLARFAASNTAVATSGDYMQPFTADFAQHHIIDPRSGYSAPELCSSTVIAPSAALADALATLTMVLGSRRSRALLEGLPGCEGYLVSKTLDVTRTSGFVEL